MNMTVGDEDDNGDGSDQIGEIIFDDAINTSHNENDDGNDSETQTRRSSKKEVLAARIKRQSIETIYQNVVKSVKETLEENDVVDIELTFKASSVHKGIPIISRSQDSSVVEIRLATRISGNPKKDADDSKERA